MIEEAHGNLLTADADALVNTVNTVGVMGKGIALQFKRAFPANFRAYRAACARGDIRLGHVWAFDTGVIGSRRYILNFPTKQHWRSSSRLADIAAGLDSLVDVVQELGIRSVAIPALGCGNGGLDWNEVRPLIEKACDRMQDVRAIVFPPEGAPSADAMPNATPQPPLTQPRALLVTAVNRYLDRARLQEVRDGISELEIQKLAYFLQVLGAPLRLTFVRGTYGPYAPQLSHVLDALEGHHLTGLGDRSARVTEFAPINPVPRSVDAAEELLADQPAELERLSTLLDLVEGFETPYSLELLATVHFASGYEPMTDDPGALADRVASWSLRKARMFTEKHVTLAAARLADRNLLPA
ncbi:macro domain-containing protein [Actinoplanes bogorensis]|uniref:Macro domain-containing protein n=1 Tax=Paractinoplanes bogorensis TaxID=1610840 RepID=A0ABS5YST4_9ACTN|nr:macro domain-containing protein [Actinoplanes bogorensis]MBU2666517.1 macro domain-containing protein [Actinoplanes bogorensis]